MIKYANFILTFKITSGIHDCYCMWFEYYCLKFVTFSKYIPLYRDINQLFTLLENYIKHMFYFECINLFIVSYPAVILKTFKYF